jgi:ferredoxin-NADP reductase
MPVATRVSTWLVGTVRAVQQVNEHARVIMVDVPDWPGSMPGQHLDLRLTAEDGYQAVRSYSIASFGPGSLVELAVDEFPGGEVSPYLVREVRAGDLVEIRGPIGRYFVWSPAQTEPVQLIAGGSGIVPLMAIVRAHHDAGSTSPFRLLYSVRSRADALYAEELGSLVDDRFALEWVYTRRAPEEVRRRPRRVDAEILSTDVIPSSQRPLVYVCGPTGFVETVAGTLVALGHDPRRIRTERFGGA